jgi:predicted DNA-binding protein with PD1-like motif
MRWKLLSENAERTFILVFDKGDEAMSELTEFAEEQGVSAAHLTGIGAFSDVTLGYFDRDAKEYEQIRLHEQVEVLTLAGDIALEEGKPKVHAHVVVGKRDGTAHGGHLLEARVWPTLEVVVSDSPAHLEKRFDPETGLALISAE